jgi:hypothetical protein
LITDAQKILKAYTLFMLKLFSFFALVILLTPFCNSQNNSRLYTKDSTQFYVSVSKVAENKIIPEVYKDAIVIALAHYPELTKINIKIKVKKKLAPLAARPKLFSIFLKPAKRKYIITISTSTIKMLQPILLEKLSFNAQVGVLGHELAHVSEFNSKSGFFFVKLALKHVFNKRAIDRFEYNTDKRCIDHGLGFQLLSWSNEVRQKLNLEKWGGANNPKTKRERYMNPETILGIIQTLPTY